MSWLPFPDRRSGADRRAKPTSPFSLASLRGSRKRSRRKEDQYIHFFVDRYGKRSIIVILITLILSFVDAFFTLNLVRAGGEELNPVMLFFLQYGPLPFLISKYVFTAFGIVVLIMFKNYPMFKGIMVRDLLLFVPMFYFLLIAYEIILVIHFPVF